MLFPTELQREGLPKELRRVSSSQCSSQQNCNEKVFPKSCAGYPLCNALPNGTAKRRSSQRAVPGILFAMLFPTELEWESLPKELCRVSSLQCSSPQNCKEKVFSKSCAGHPLRNALPNRTAMRKSCHSCAGYPLCNALPNRTAKRRSSQRAVPGILFAMLFPTEVQREGLLKELCRVSSSQCSSQQNCKEKVFPKSCAGYPLCNALPNRTAKRRSSQRAAPGILFAMLFPTELQWESLPKELRRISSLQCSSQRNCKEKVFPKSCAGHPLCNAFPYRTGMRKSSQRAVSGILFAMLFHTELQREGLLKELRRASSSQCSSQQNCNEKVLPQLCRVSSLQCSSKQNCKEKVFSKSCAGYPLCNALPNRTAKRRSSQRAVPGILFAMLFPTELQREGLLKELCRVSSSQCSSQQNCNEKVFPKSCAGYPLCNALPNRTAKRRSSQRAAPGILFAMLLPTELQREGLLKELRRVSSSQCSSQQNCKEKVFPKSCAGHPLRNALPNRTAMRKSSQRAAPGILFAMLFPTELQREGLPKELCRASSLQCFSLQNCNEKVFPKSCAGYPLCNALPNRTAKRRSSQRAVPGILFAMLFPTELQWESLPKELCRVASLQCSSQQNCKEKVFSSFNVSFTSSRSAAIAFAVLPMM